MPTTLPPAQSSVEPAEPLVARRIKVQVAPPTEDDPGAVIEGAYTLEGNTLRVYDVDHNLLIFEGKNSPNGFVSVIHKQIDQPERTDVGPGWPQ
jgi:hypothetical protein